MIGGAYSVGCTASYVTTAANVNLGQQIFLRHTSAVASSTKTDTTLTVGGVSDTFSDRLLEQNAVSAWRELDPADDTDAMPHLVISFVSYRIAVSTP